MKHGVSIRFATTDPALMGRWRLPIERAEASEDADGATRVVHFTAA